MKFRQTNAIRNKIKNTEHYSETNFVSEVWVFKKRDTEKLEATLMNFL